MPLQKQFHYEVYFSSGKREVKRRASMPRESEAIAHGKLSGVSHMNDTTLVN